ncbi:hypothetical protein ACFXGI_34605 [Streptomyces sp. NPDC059355]|uniref:hypothetical protein n=1 Tax=Streptomyces sp. NPDC059355 TaxID=3346811 RepID=UPI00369BBAA6
MHVRRSSRRHRRSAAGTPSCGTASLSGGLRVVVFVVVAVVVVALTKSGQSMLDAFGLVAVAAGAAAQISAVLSQPAAALPGGEA